MSCGREGDIDHREPVKTHTDQKRADREYVEKIVCAFVRSVENLSPVRQKHSAAVMAEIGRSCALMIEQHNFRGLERRLIELVEKFGVSGDLADVLQKSLEARR
jgi:hypothetical protein